MSLTGVDDGVDLGSSAEAVNAIHANPRVSEKERHHLKSSQGLEQNGSMPKAGKGDAGAQGMRLVFFVLVP